MAGKHALNKNIFCRKKTRKCTIRITIAYIIMFGLVSAITYINESVFNAVQGVFYLLTVTGSVVACLWASRYSTMHKRFWQILSIGMVSWLCSVLINCYYIIQVGPKNIPSPNITDIFIIAYGPIIFGILYSIGKINRPLDPVKKQVIVDITMAGLAMFLLCFELILIPIFSSGILESQWQKILAVIYPMFDWIMLTSLLFASYRLFEKNTEGWLVFLIAASTCRIIADIETYILGYRMSVPYMVFTIFAAIMIIYSAIDEVTGSLHGLAERTMFKSSGMNSKQSQIMNTWRTLILPSLTAYSVPFVWVVAIYPKISPEIIILAGTSALIIGLLIYRNHLLVSENTVLFLKTLRDSLTGLHNHRYFQEMLQKTMQKAQKSEKPLSLILIDIDNFSKFNKKYGHMVGDQVLTIVSETLLLAVRDTDEACRLSADEFAVILPRTDEREALKAARIIFKRMNNKLADELPGREISISIGLSSYPSLASSKDELLKTADGALYWVKLDGGNKTLLYDQKIVEVMNAEERSRKMEEVASLDMVRSLARAVDARDSYTRLHSTRVGYLARRIAERMDLDENTINTVEIAGILHDVGKIGISDVILNKPGKLNTEEIAAIRTHPELSAKIISSTSLKEIIPYVRSHHERWDGNGYPDGLKGEEIPLIARIIAVADSFDAMTSERPYRESLGIGMALKEVKRCSGTQFDPLIVEHFLAIYGLNNYNILFEYDQEHDSFLDVSVNF